jgi:UDP-N-acetyl-D-mannosaminuronic acid dehydrogenase
MSLNTVSVIGLGYIGLPTAAMLASQGVLVIGVDVNQDTVDIINKGKIHIVEPGLDVMVHSAVTEGRFKAVTTPEPADAFLIAVPTPFKMGDSLTPEPDLSYIESAARAVSKVLKKGDLIILESTSPVGTTEKMIKWLVMERPDLKFPQHATDDVDVNVAYCPERVLPGQVVRELVENDRVIGGLTKKCSLRAIELYKSFVKGECVVTDARTAEMAKLTENACRDVQLAFANELSFICDDLNINVWELIELANRHPRINILQPGPGVGGHCIAIDPWFIVSSSREQAKLIQEARNINDSKPRWVIKKVRNSIADFLIANPNKTEKDIVITCYGLSFKPDIDDLRESPALYVAEELAKMHSGRVVAVEPNYNGAISHTKLEIVHELDDYEIGDIVVMLVDHKEFKCMPKPAVNHIIDTRGVWEF